jgi:hypothetical protein
MVITTGKFLTDKQIEMLRLLVDAEIKTYGSNYPLMRIEYEEIKEVLEK